jgi:hypothetical protein
MKRFLIFSLLLCLSVPAVSQAAQGDHDRYRERDRDRDERRSSDRDWRDLKDPNKSWTLLTKQEVNFRDDRDRINVGDVGRHDGRFKELQIRVDGAPVEIRKMVVTFDNGERFDAIHRHRFDDNSRTLVIDLPGGQRRDIKSIDLNYYSVNNQQRVGRGTLMVYAR